ncbi:MAG: C39 family peptidase [Oscillospiraceae bacterium]|nr:C39 family peptidase [Oscillospiraceae bacterium]
MRKYKYQKQETDSWCGPTCLSMIYESFGKELSQRNIMQEILLADIENYTTNISQLVKHVEKNGLLSRGVVTREPLALLEWSGKNNIILIVLHKTEKDDSNKLHYSIFDKLEDDKYYAVDPYYDDFFPKEINEMLELWNIPRKGFDFYDAVIITDNKELSVTDKCFLCDKEYNSIKMPPQFSNDIVCPHCFGAGYGVIVRHGFGFTNVENDFSKFHKTIYESLADFTKDSIGDAYKFISGYTSIIEDSSLPFNDIRLTIDKDIIWKMDFTGATYEEIAEEIISSLKEFYKLT